MIPKDVILKLGEQKLLAHVAHDGEVHQVDYGWHEKEPSDMPPRSWFDSVCGEVDYVLAERLRVSKGGIPKDVVG